MGTAGALVYLRVKERFHDPRAVRRIPKASLVQRSKALLICELSLGALVDQFVEASDFTAKGSSQQAFTDVLIIWGEICLKLLVTVRMHARAIQMVVLLL
jgi:predicted membrane protein